MENPQDENGSVFLGIRNNEREAGYYQLPRSLHTTGAADTRMVTEELDTIPDFLSYTIGDRWVVLCYVLNGMFKIN